MLGQAICEHLDEIVDLWYQKWKQSTHPHPEIPEAEIKDKLPLQLRLIGEELKKSSGAELPEEMWKITDRLDPEERVPQNIHIDEVVHEYRMVIGVVRTWVFQKQIKVTFNEFSYFYEAILELIAESVRRFAEHQADMVGRDRAEYLAALTHQMRSPLAVVSTHLEILETQTGQEKAAEILEKMKRNVNRLIFLINGVMRLERFKSDELPVRPHEIYPADLLNQILLDYQFEARSKKLLLETHMNYSLRMKTDPELFVDIMGNLIENAIKYTQKGYVRVDVRESGDIVIFKVTDSGSGISPERKKELFKLTRSKASGGVGIGLVIVERAVAALEGEVDVESELNKGSTFTVKLPRDSAAKNLPKAS